MTFLDNNFPIFEYENFDTHVIYEIQASCLHKFQELLELLENLERGIPELLEIGSLTTTKVITYMYFICQNVRLQELSDHRSLSINDESVMKSSIRK